MNISSWIYSRENLQKTLKALAIKENIDKLDSITFNNFCSLEDTVKRLKMQATECEKIFQHLCNQ